MKLKLTVIATAVLMSNIAYAQSEKDIEVIVVKGQYLSINESNSIKTPTPIIDVPQSLSIFTAEQISERGITSIGQMIDYTPGVNNSQGEGHRDSIVFRGNRSTADFYIDGNRDDVQYYRALYNVEQVEILRGPNALLFGRGGTGGILNRVSKKAQVGENFNAYKASLNSFGGFNLELDSNIDTSNTSSVRINAMYESLENNRDFFDGERYGFNPTARLELSDNTTVDVSYEYVNHQRFIDRGIPTGTDGMPVEALKDIVFADPKNNYHELEAHIFRANIAHQFTDNIKGNFSAFYGDYDKVYANFYASGYDQNTNIVELDGYIDNTVRDNLILSSNMIAEFQTGNFEHTLIVGADFVQTNSDQNRFNPVFSSTIDDREFFIASRPISLRGFAGVNASGESFTTDFTDLNDDTRVGLDVFSLYIQDEIEISKHLDIIIGARFDSFDIEVFNAVPSSLETRSRKDEQVSPRAGIIYKPQENVSIYASYSESFLPRSGEQFANINGNNNQLDPDTFANQEIGIKWDFADGLSLTAALFENEQSSPQVADNDPATLDIIDSEISGFELQLAGQVTDAWSVSFNYSTLDGEIVDRNGGTGRSPREVPESNISIWNTYQINDVMGLGLGATYQDESFIDNSNTAILPSYTRFDASAYYDVSDTMRIQLNVENLTDKLYYPNSHSTHQATVAVPFNARLSIIGGF
ncbi:TonB-dependent receptor [Brumicola pallidula]|uniref:Iron complex outermembrane recepter protein n=1 Tax=Brumicola pallidula DSM 14239 = ACAM 615 TaxID=1121922 RepID=K6ZET8_9ALTE|nr:TonB-dependent siderophore receptor [Glaciecola pallidula]GAC27443.1 iron complex outermembrane recepter protein [Glaciecola pallidula DSM 14239 = ACAM 615]